MSAQGTCNGKSQCNSRLTTRTKLLHVAFFGLPGSFGFEQAPPPLTFARLPLQCVQVPKGPLHTKNAVEPESVVFCYRRGSRFVRDSFLLMVPQKKTSASEAYSELSLRTPGFFWDVFQDIV